MNAVGYCELMLNTFTDKSWLWSAYDCSDGEPKADHLAWTLVDSEVRERVSRRERPALASRANVEWLMDKFNLVQLGVGWLSDKSWVVGLQLFRQTTTCSTTGFDICFQSVVAGDSEFAEASKLFSNVQGDTTELLTFCGRFSNRM